MTHKSTEPLWNNKGGDCGQTTLRTSLSPGHVGLDLTEHPAGGDDQLEPDGACCGVAPLHGPFAALQKASKSVRAHDYLAATARLLRVQRLHSGPPQEGVGCHVVTAKDIEIGPGGSRHDDG